MDGTCTGCGAALSGGAAFCASCGKPVAGARHSPTSSSPTSPSPNAPPPYTPYERNPFEQHTYRHGSYGRASGNVSPMQAMVIPFQRYADFKGRSSRLEYWMFTLLYWAVMIFGFALVGIGGATAEKSQGGDLPLLGGIGITIVILWWLVTIIPCLALDVRRLHDQDKAGALVILFIGLTFIFSIFGWIVQTVFMCIDGTPGPNQYGPDPNGPVDTGDIFR
jgi:uncharacterized membrane protein YhaH (DUF805 family)